MELWLKRVHPEDRDRIRSIVIRQDAGEIPYNAFEYRERHRDGHYIWILSRGRPVEWFPDGKPARIVGTDTDISSLKLVTEELADEKERLNVTLQSIGDGVISTDAAARVTFMNPTAERMTGWSSADAVGRPVSEVFDIVSETGTGSLPNPVATCLAQQQPYRISDDLVLIGRHGEQRNVRESAAPVRTPDGRIIGAVLVFQDVTQSRVLQKQLTHSAMHDSLTGLPNRSAFERALRITCEQAANERRKHVLCFIDLDRFKAVNDTAGHAAGDALLRKVGETIRVVCRTQDFTARIGGDEFALILADCPIEAAERVAQEIIDAVGALRFTWQGTEYRIGASVGLTAIGAETADPAEAMSRADAACYAAKAAGRNGRVVFSGAEAATGRFQQSA
jgi:diguanylate cyclase